jgi:putative restriction endonuclease
MVNGIFYHKSDSGYDDRPDSYYHFPSQYLERVKACIGSRIVYYGPLPGRPGRYYLATARVTGVRPDPIKQNHYYADVDEYLDFDDPLDYRANGGFERKLILPNGKVSGGQAVNAVRNISSDEFAAIVEAGLSRAEEWPDRTDSVSAALQSEGMSEDPLQDIVRPMNQQVINSPFREAKFKQSIRRIYDRTCAFTGLRLINGGGRPEVEAAHIIPVDCGGSDSVRNGIALSGTVHWMFDRGLISLADDFRIITSRQLNEDISHLLRADMRARVPSDPRLQPHPSCLAWHRNNRLKV